MPVLIAILFLVWLAAISIAPIIANRRRRQK